MYEKFFGLRKPPFNLTPDPAFLFLSPKHREALAGLTYAVLRRKGFVVLTGDAGTGKTTLLSSSLARLSESQVRSSVILNPTLTPSEFLESVLLDFGIPDVPTSKAQRLWKLQELLLETHREGKIAILVIDEAHKLSLDVLEEIRLLGNFEYAADKLLQILLLGQCELDDLLNTHELRQFKQRVALRLYIDPLTSAEVREYIRFRWAIAGGAETVPFSSDAVAGIVQWSRGIPRLVNSLCDSALLMAYGEGSHTVTGNYVRDAATSLALVEAPRTHSQPNALFHAASALPEEIQENPRLMAVEVSTQTDALPEFVQTDQDCPKLAPYGVPSANSSLLQRLAGKFGF